MQMERKEVSFCKICISLYSPLSTGLNFILKSYWEIKDGTQVQNVKYTPKELDKESPEFRERLEFLGDTFTFERHQIQVFFEQLKDHVAGAIGQDASDDREVIDLQDDEDDMYE